MIGHLPNARSICDKCNLLYKILLTRFVEFRVKMHHFNRLYVSSYQINQKRCQPELNQYGRSCTVYFLNSIDICFLCFSSHLKNLLMLMVLVPERAIQEKGCDVDQLQWQKASTFLDLGTSATCLHSTSYGCGCWTFFYI
jgi:hypothetical protein